tara:strand:+ start:626 stop:733 length:108 start_codon:yes stop_codon:yes gene_type:complete
MVLKYISKLVTKALVYSYEMDKLAYGFLILKRKRK